MTFLESTDKYPEVQPKKILEKKHFRRPVRVQNSFGSRSLGASARSEYQSSKSVFQCNELRHERNYCQC